MTTLRSASVLTLYLKQGLKLPKTGFCFYSVATACLFWVDNKARRMFVFRGKELSLIISGRLSMEPFHRNDRCVLKK